MDETLAVLSVVFALLGGVLIMLLIAAIFVETVLDE